MYISKYFAQNCRYGIKLKCHFTNDHDWWCHQFGHMVVMHLMSVKVRNDVTIQLQGESFSFTSYLQTYIWKSCPFHSKYLPSKIWLTFTMNHLCMHRSDLEGHVSGYGNFHVSMEIRCTISKFHENHTKHSEVMTTSLSGGRMYFSTQTCAMDWGGDILFWSF